MKLFDGIMPCNAACHHRQAAWSKTLGWSGAEYFWGSFNGGHAVISIGHTHRTIFVSESKINFGSDRFFIFNSVQIPIQKEYVQISRALLPAMSIKLFFFVILELEANENALKMGLSLCLLTSAFISYSGAFMGEHPPALHCTDNRKDQIRTV